MRYDHYLPEAAVSRLRNAALFAQEEQAEGGESFFFFFCGNSQTSQLVFSCPPTPAAPVSSLFPNPVPLSPPAIPISNLLYRRLAGTERRGRGFVGEPPFVRWGHGRMLCRPPSMVETCTCPPTRFSPWHVAVGPM